MENIVLKIAKQLYMSALDKQMLSLMQEVDKQILSFWNSEEVIVDFITCALLNQDITNSKLGKSIPAMFGQYDKAKFDVNDLRKLVYNSYSKLYTDITFSISIETRKKMKNIGKDKIKQWVEDNLKSNKSLQNMQKSLQKYNATVLNKLKQVKIDQDFQIDF